MRPSEHATFEEFHAALEATWRETWARAYALRDECERCATRLSTSSPSPPHSPGPSDAADPLHTTPSNSQGREGGALPGRGRQEQRGEPARQDTRQQGDDVSAPPPPDSSAACPFLPCSPERGHRPPGAGREASGGVARGGRRLRRRAEEGCRRAVVLRVASAAKRCCGAAAGRGGCGRGGRAVGGR